MGVSSWRRRMKPAAMLLILVSSSAIAGGLQQQIDACAEIDENDDRLACFDALASAGNRDRVPATAAQAPAPAETPAAMPAAASTVTDTGERSPAIIAKEEDVFNVRLTRCGQTSATGRQVYYLDNGEVWQQSNSSRNTVRNCDTAVTIEKDAFGYKMHVPSENRRIRIRPVQ